MIWDSSSPFTAKNGGLVWLSTLVQRFYDYPGTDQCRWLVTNNSYRHGLCLWQCICVAADFIAGVCKCRCGLDITDSFPASLHAAWSEYVTKTTFTSAISVCVNCSDRDQRFLLQLWVARCGHRPHSLYQQVTGSCSYSHTQQLPAMVAAACTQSASSSNHCI